MGSGVPCADALRNFVKDKVKRGEWGMPEGMHPLKFFLNGSQSGRLQYATSAEEDKKKTNAWQCGAPLLSEMGVGGVGSWGEVMGWGLEVGWYAFSLTILCLLHLYSSFLLFFFSSFLLFLFSLTMCAIACPPCAPFPPHHRHPRTWRIHHPKDLTSENLGIHHPKDLGDSSPQADDQLVPQSGKHHRSSGTTQNHSMVQWRHAIGLVPLVTV